MDAITGMIPGMGGDEESPEEKERQRKAAIMQAEKERRTRYKKQEEDREVERQTIRDKVLYFFHNFFFCQIFLKIYTILHFIYNL